MIPDPVLVTGTTALPNWSNDSVPRVATPLMVPFMGTKWTAL